MGNKDYFRCSLSQVFCWKVILKNLAVFAGKHLQWRSFITKATRLALLFGIKGLHRLFFPLHLSKTFRAAFSQNNSRLMLKLWESLSKTFENITESSYNHHTSTIFKIQQLTTNFRWSLKSVNEKLSFNPFVPSAPFL